MKGLHKADEILISHGCKYLSKKESFERYEIQYLNPKKTGIAQIGLNKTVLKEIIQPTSLGNMTLSCSNLENDLFSDCISSNLLSIDEFTDKAPEVIDTISITISKTVKPGFLVIVCADAFYDHLTELGTLDALKNISKVAKINSGLAVTIEGIYVSQDDKTKSIYPRKDELLKKRNEGCNFENAANIQLTPYDFLIQKIDHDGLYNLFSAYKNALSAVFLLNYSKIINDALVGTLCGFKKRENQEKHINDLSDYDQLFNIFDWVYRNNSFIESLEISRNIMSLHILDNCIFKYDQDSLLSIKSNYNLISKQCTKDYLETKQQIESNIYKNSETMRDQIRSYQSQLTSMMFILLTLFFTVIITGAINGNGYDIFKQDVLVIYWLFYVLFLVTFVFRTIGEFLAIKSIREEQTDFFKRYDHLIDSGEMNLYKVKAEKTKFKFFTVYRVFWLVVLMILFLLFILQTPEDFLCWLFNR